MVPPPLILDFSLRCQPSAGSLRISPRLCSSSAGGFPKDHMCLGNICVTYMCAGHPLRGFSVSNLLCSDACRRVWASFVSPKQSQPWRSHQELMDLGFCPGRIELCFSKSPIPCTGGKCQLCLPLLSPCPGPQCCCRPPQPWQRSLQGLDRTECCCSNRFSLGVSPCPRTGLLQPLMHANEALNAMAELKEYSSDAYYIFVGARALPGVSLKAAARSII